MKENNSSTLFSSILTGLGIGFPVTLLCMTLIGGFNEIIAELLTWMVASALFGIVSHLTFFKSDLSMLLATAIHCVCCLLIVVGACLICGYTDNLLTLFTAILPVFIIVYAIIYLFCFLSMKKYEKEINETRNK